MKGLNFKQLAEVKTMGDLQKLELEYPEIKDLFPNTFALIEMRKINKKENYAEELVEEICKK